MNKIKQVNQLKLTTNKDKNEKIVIDVVKDKFSSSEISKLTQCIKEIEQNSSNRHIIWKDDKVNEKIIIYIQNGTLSVEERQLPPPLGGGLHLRMQHKR